MLTSELIRELKEHLEKDGDLPVCHSIQSRADVEIDRIQSLTNKVGLANTYLDNYTLTTEQKITNIEKEIKEYVEKNKICCNNCKWYNEEYSNHAGVTLPFCMYNMRILLFSDREWVQEKDKLFDCFNPKDEHLDKLLYYRSILLKEHKREKEAYLKNGVEWKSRLNALDVKRRTNELIPYSIIQYGRKEILLTDKELLRLYDKLTDIIVDNEELIR